MKRYSQEYYNVYLDESSTVVGPLEKEGPLGNYFDLFYPDLFCNEKTFEKAEMKLLSKSIELTLKKSKLKPDLAISGDLINQNIISNYTYCNYDIPFIGVYGACSNFNMSIITACNFIKANNCNNVLISTSSHNLTSERQFRYPVEYGGPRPMTATFTATGAVSLILTNKERLIKITKSTISQIIKSEIKDPNNLGCAMAPVAVEVFLNHLKDFNLKPNNYDLILTGDLSNEGMKIFKEAVETKLKIKLTNYSDCGITLYNIKKQKVFSGGSGCATVGLVTLTYVLNKLINKEINNCLIIATGALMNQIILNQKETIATNAICISLERSDIDDRI